VALGNSNSSVQSRGKNKALLVKRTREVNDAANFHTISGTINLAPSVSNHSNCCDTSESLGSTYYHNAGSLAGYTTNTYVYTAKRDNAAYYLEDGYYKVTHDSSAFKSIQIASGKIASLATCR
jgi:hypothetical protein